MEKKWETPSFDPKSIYNDFLGTSKQEFAVFRDVLVDFRYFHDFYYMRFLGMFHFDVKNGFLDMNCFQDAFYR